MQVVKRLCSCIVVGLFALMTLLPVMAVEPKPPVQEPVVQESSAFIELQIEHFSLESGRNAAQNMLLGTLTSFSDTVPIQRIDTSTQKPMGLSFSWSAAGLFALVLVGAAGIGFVLYKVRHKAPTH